VGEAKDDEPRNDAMMEQRVPRRRPVPGTRARFVFDGQEEQRAHHRTRRGQRAHDQERRFDAEVVVHGAAEDRSQSQAGQRHRSVHSHEASFATMRRDVADIRLYERHQHGRGNAMQRACNDQQREVVNVPEQHRYERVEGEPRHDPALAPAAVGMTAEPGSAHQAREREGAGEQSDVKPGPSQLVGVKRKQRDRHAATGTVANTAKNRRTAPGGVARNFRHVTIGTW
jgi:hypothetical protein